MEASRKEERFFNMDTNNECCQAGFIDQNKSVMAP